MTRIRGWVVLVLSTILSLLIVGSGCANKDAKSRAVAKVNGDTITVAELREFLGIRGKEVTASSIPIAMKKEALDRLIGGHLLAIRARTLGLDKTEEFRNGVERNRNGVLITALFRKQVADMKLPTDVVHAEAEKLRAADNSLSLETAKIKAEQTVTQRELRKVEEEIIAAARKEFPSVIDNILIHSIETGDTVSDNAALAVVAGEPVTYGEVKGLLAGMTRRMHGDQDLSRNPIAISRMLNREVTGKALAAYAKKQGIEGSMWMKQVQDEMERSTLIDLVAEKEILKNIGVTDEDVRESYEEHAQMFVREGKKIPLAQVQGQIRQFLENERRKKALEDYIAEMREKSKVTVNEKLLPDV